MTQSRWHYRIVGWVGMAAVVVLALVAFWGRGVTRGEAVRLATQHIMREHPEVGRSLEVAGEFRDNGGNWSIYFRGPGPDFLSYSVTIRRDGKVEGAEEAEHHVNPPAKAEAKGQPS
jgi:hypothetical protein